MTRSSCLACLCLVALSPAAVLSQDREALQAQRRLKLRTGTDVFRRILFEHHLRPLDGFLALAEQPNKSILIVLGDLHHLTRIPGGLERFVRAGGAVLVASDRPIQDPRAHQQLVQVAGVSISPRTLVCEEPEKCYDRLRFCPYVVPIENANPPLFRPPGGFNRIGRVATNVPSMLLPDRPQRGIRLLAELPDHCDLESDGHFQPWPGRPPFAVGGELGSGRVLVLADHSLFINEMMLPHDTGNVEFSYNCVRWLQGEGGQRDRVLFFEDGRHQTSFETPLRSVNIRPEEMLRLLFERRNELLVQAEGILAQSEENGWLDNKLLEVLDDLGLPPHRLVNFLAVLGTVVLLFYLLYRLGVRHRFRHDPSVPLLAHAVGRNLPVGPLVAQRQHMQLTAGNVFEPAARLVRAWFARLGVEVPVSRAAASSPAFRVRGGGWWGRRQQRRRLAWLWRLARGLEPIRISPAELWRLERELDTLRQDWQLGKWSVGSG